MDVFNNKSHNQNASNNVAVTANQNSILSTNDTVRKRLLTTDSPIICMENQSLESVSNVKRQRQSSKEGKDMFCILVSNLPYEWTYEQITEYIGEHCDGQIYGIKVLENGDADSGKSVRLSFLSSFEKCNQTRKQLKLKTVNGRNLNAIFDDPLDSDSDSSTSATLLLEKGESKTPTPSSWQPDVEIWAEDSDELYGLRPEFLETLGITTPIDKWVHVSNFRCDKSELKEVLELAGHVVICNVVTMSKKYAQVMYSHPLEAVQAVSMLNGQIFYGQVLKVSMYKSPNNEGMLPKGLMSIGSGLGMYGKPLRDVAREYERYLNGMQTTVDANIFNARLNPIEKSPEKSIFKKENNQSPHKSGYFRAKTDEGSLKSEESLITDAVISPRKNDFNITHSIQSHQVIEPNHIYNTWSLASNVPITNPHQRAPGPSGVRFNSTQSCQANPVNRVSGPRFRPQVGCFENPSQGPNSWGGNVAPINNTIQNTPVAGSSIVELRNLPLTTTFPLLCEKMTKIGQVLSLQFTTPGCAIVRFASAVHAQNCYREYHDMIANTNRIVVRFL